MRPALILSSILILLILLAFPLQAYDDTQYARLFVTKRCHKCDLYKANFYGADLTNFDFTGSNLILANFQKATLLGANLSSTTLTGANFNGAMWVDGSICQSGSYGRCIKKAQ